MVASPAGVRALREMIGEIYQSGIVPRAVLTWHEEETRFAFQNGETAMHAQLALRVRPDGGQRRVSASRGRFAVAPMPAAPAAAGPRRLWAELSSRSTANAEHPEAAWTVIEYLTRPEQMLERAAGGGAVPYPRPRCTMTRTWRGHCQSLPPTRARIIERAVRGR